MSPHEFSECPLCSERMQPEELEEEILLVCPNGCPTEVAIRKPAAPETAEPHARKARTGA